MGWALQAWQSERDESSGVSAQVERPRLEHLAPGLELGQVLVASAGGLEGAGEVEAEIVAGLGEAESFGGGGSRGGRRAVRRGQHGLGEDLVEHRPAAACGNGIGKDGEDVGLLAELGFGASVGHEAFALVPAEPHHRLYCFLCGLAVGRRSSAIAQRRLEVGRLAQRVDHLQRDRGRAPVLVLRRHARGERRPSNR